MNQQELETFIKQIEAFAAFGESMGWEPMTADEQKLTGDFFWSQFQQ